GDGGRAVTRTEGRAQALQIGVEALAELQDMLYAQDRWAVLLIFQASDAAGKDGAIENVMSGVNPQGCEVYSFQQRRAVVRRARRQQVVHAGDRGVCDHRYARVARVAVPQGEQGEEEGTGRREAHAAAFRLIMVAPATRVYSARSVSPGAGLEAPGHPVGPEIERAVDL